MAASYAITFPNAPPGANDYVLKAQTDGTTSWEVDLANNSQGTNTNNFGASPEDNTEITMNFNMASVNDGKFSWLEPDGGNFLFYNDVQMNSSSKIDAFLYIKLFFTIKIDCCRII